jgi:deazaflavin-dependent oxidoreductase (nitroreductase family)
MIAFVRKVLVLMLVLAGLFVVGMRRKWPPVLNAVRRASKASKPVVLRTAGTEGAWASVVRHTGRRSGRTYETPVVAARTPDGFAIALPYGSNTDWLNNVLASGSATLVAEGARYEVDRPEVVPIADVETYFEAREHRQHRQFAVSHALRVRRSTTATEEGADSAVATST